jgi:hypothetical protein
LIREAIISAVDYATLLADAERLGFVYTNEMGDKILMSSGVMANGFTYALNYVGQIYASTSSLPPEKAKTAAPYPGVWARVRINGDFPEWPSFSANTTVYQYDADLKSWTSDGSTIAPEWIGNIGFIA